MKVEPRTLKGFRDFLPKEARKRQFVIDTLRSVFESYGFEPLETPALEYEDILLGKYGEEGDKLMYRFMDNGGRNVALRYDQTVPLARVVAQYQNDLPFPFKRYQIQNVWRAENTQKGRFREFLQCDIDTVGTSSYRADAEIIACIATCLDKLGFKEYTILINDRKIFEENYVKTSFNIDVEKIPFIFRAIDKLGKIGIEGVSQELMNIGFTNTESEEILQKIREAKPSPAIEENIFTALEDLNISRDKYRFDPTLARGLDYYTQMVFEVIVPGVDYSIAGGGRYDNLIGIFTDQQTPAVGGAFGFDRILEVMEEKGLFDREFTITKALIIATEDNQSRAMHLSSRLRLNNINCEVYLNPSADMDKQYKYVEKKGIPYVVVPLNESEVELRWKKDNGEIEKKTVTFEQLIGELT